MINDTLKAIGHALALCAAIAAAGCNTEGGPAHLKADGGPVAQYAAASGAARRQEAAAPAAADTEHPTHAEARHFAIYNHYRALVESSGSSGAGSQMRSGGDPQLVPIPGGSLFGIEQSVCPGDAPGK